MQEIDDIVSQINTHLKDNSFKDRKFHDTNYVGITELVPFETSEEGRIQVIPAIVQADAEAQPITLDDNFPMQVYHRMNSRTPTKQKNQVGDSNINVADTYDMTIFIIADRDKITETQATIDQLAFRMFPDIIKQAGKVTCNIEPGRTDFRTKTIFESEFQGLPYSGFYQYFMTKMDYQVKPRSYRRKCEVICN